MGIKEFQPASKCENRQNCKLYGLCWGASQIRGHKNPDLSHCNHNQAVEARREIKDLYDLNKPLPQE